MEIPIRGILGEIMKETRLALRISVTEAAARAEVSKGYWSKMESGYAWPTPQNFLAISSALGLCPSEVFFQIGEAIRQLKKETGGVGKKGFHKSKNHKG